MRLPIRNQRGTVVGHTNIDAGTIRSYVDDTGVGFIRGYTDDTGTTWLPPTAEAYYRVCQLRDRLEQELRDVAATQAAVDEEHVALIELGKIMLQIMSRIDAIQKYAGGDDDKLCYEKFFSMPDGRCWEFILRIKQ